MKLLGFQLIYGDFLARSVRAFPVRHLPTSSLLAIN